MTTVRQAYIYYGNSHIRNIAYGYYEGLRCLTKQNIELVMYVEVYAHMHHILNNINTFAACLVVLWLHCVLGNSSDSCIDGLKVSVTDSQITRGPSQ